MKHLANALSSGFGSGYINPAPGTWGTLAGILVFWTPVFFFGWESHSTAVFFFILTCIGGFWSISESLRYILPDRSKGIKSEKTDPSWIVIDEWAGVYFTLIFIPATLQNVIIAFLLFRFFDISKLWPIKKIEKLPGAAGILLDDVAAGGYAVLTYFGILFLIKLVA